MIRLAMRGCDQGGDQRTSTRTSVAVQRNHAPTNQEGGRTFDNDVHSVAGQRADHFVAHPGDANAGNGVRDRCGYDFPAVGGGVT